MARAKARMHAALGGSADEIEAAFYECLQTGNLERMVALWADDEEVACIHPGGTRLHGVAAIRASFEQLFQDGGVIPVEVAQVHRADSLTSAVHHVVERVTIDTEAGTTHGYVLASNVYHKTAQGWRMVLHHASPAAPDALLAHADAPQVLH